MNASAKQRGPVQLARLAARVFDPVTAKRGFAKIDLIAAWSDVVGPRYAANTQPEKLQWPRDRSDGAVLTVRVSGPSSVFLQHETEQFIGRINSFLGFAAVSELRIIQRPITKTGRPMPPKQLDLPPADKAAIRQELADIDGGDLREALARLGTAIAQDRLARP